MSARAVYDKAYFQGTSETRGNFDLLEIGEKYKSRWQYLEKYLKRTSANTKRTSNQGWIIGDVGAGAVNLARLVDTIVPTIRVKSVISTDLSRAGYDLTEGMKPKEMGRKPFSISNAQEMPFADGSFDMIVSWDLFEHLPDPAQGLTEVTRALQPGGVLHFITPNPNSYKKGTDVDTYFRDKTHINPPIISTDFFRGQLEALGYTNIEVQTRGFPETKEYAAEHQGDDLFLPEGGTHIVVYATKADTAKE